MLENHVVLGQRARLISKDVLYLPQILINRSVVSGSIPIVLLGVSLLIADQDRPLEQLDHFHGDHQRNRNKVSHQQPPSHRSNPVIRHRNKTSDLLVTVLQDRIEKRTHQRNQNLPNKNLYDYLVHLLHQLTLLRLKTSRVQHQLSVHTRVTTNTHHLMHVLQCTTTQQQVLRRQRNRSYLSSRIVHKPVELVQHSHRSPSRKLIG